MMNGENDKPSEDVKEHIQEEHKQDPAGTEDKYGVDPDKPYEPIPGNPADGSN